MAELELLRSLDAAHECLDGRPILRQQRVDVRTREHFFRMCGGEAIERFVQIHDQPMQAVAIVAIRKPGQLDDLFKRDGVRRTERRQCTDRCEACYRRVRRVAVTGFHPAKHGLHVVPDGNTEICQTGRRDLVAGQCGVVDQGFQCDVIKAGIAAFARHIEARTLRIAGTACGRLQNTQPKL